MNEHKSRTISTITGTISSAYGEVKPIWLEVIYSKLVEFPVNNRLWGYVKQQHYGAVKILLKKPEFKLMKNITKAVSINSSIFKIKINFNENRCNQYSEKDWYL